MKRLPFGLACAPAILSAVLNDAMSNLPSCSDIFLHIYVDDLIVINNDLQTLTNTINDVNSRLSSVGFLVHKNKTNSTELKTTFGWSHDDEVKILGIVWSAERDTVSICFPPFKSVCTKRDADISVLIKKITKPVYKIDSKTWQKHFCRYWRFSHQN